MLEIIRPNFHGFKPTFYFGLTFSVGARATLNLNHGKHRLALRFTPDFAAPRVRLDGSPFSRPELIESFPVLHGGLPREWKELFRVDKAVASYVLNTFECADRCVLSDVIITFQMHSFDSFKYARELRGFYSLAEARHGGRPNLQDGDTRDPVHK